MIYIKWLLHCYPDLYNLAKRIFFPQTVNEEMMTIFNALLYDINKAIPTTNLKEQPLDEATPMHYYKFLPLFNTVLANW
jgi:hypothetical protein